MIVFPAMDLVDGNVVKLEAGGHREVEIVYGTPADVAARWLGAGAEWLHLVDLDATLGRARNNLDVLAALVPAARAADARLMWGGGVRDDAALDACLAAGADRAIVGTRAVADSEWLAAASARRPDRIVVAVDAMGRDVVVKGWQERSGEDVVKLVDRLGALPIAGFLYTNVAVEGKGAGVDWEPVKAVVDASPKPVVFSGGVTTMDEVARFKSIGAYGIIVGSALYRNRIDFAAAAALARS